MAAGAPADATFRGSSGSSPRELVLGGYGLTGSDPEVRGRRALTLPASIALHAAAALALVVVPLLVAEDGPEPATGVRAFLVEPMSVPPPPPPPPARPAAAPRVVQKAKPVEAQAFVAPVEIPTEITPEQALDLGVEGGAADGVEGGVAGGVVGGIVGGLPEAPPPPVVPVRVGGAIKEPRRIVSVPPVYPELATRARVQGNVVVEATVDERGRVVGVSLVEGTPLLNDAALDAVRKWVYSPTLLNGVPTPIVMTVTVRFRLNDSLG